MAAAFAITAPAATTLRRCEDGDTSDRGASSRAKQSRGEEHGHEAASSRLVSAAITAIVDRLTSGRWRDLPKLTGENDDTATIDDREDVAVAAAHAPAVRAAHERDRCALDRRIGHPVAAVV
jgi:hypothetical protein